MILVAPFGFTCCDIRACLASDQGSHQMKIFDLNLMALYETYIYAYGGRGC